MKQCPNIVILQETHLKKALVKVPPSKKFAQQYQIGTSWIRGVAILSSSGTRFVLQGSTKDPRRRCLFLKGLFGNKQVTLANIYAPSTSQLTFWGELFSKLMEFSEGELIIGGYLKHMANLYWVNHIAKRIDSAKIQLSLSYSHFFKCTVWQAYGTKDN